MQEREDIIKNHERQVKELEDLIDTIKEEEKLKVEAENNDF